MRRAYKLRAYPTRPQEGRAVRLLADHCDLYNAALTERREAWRMQKVTVSYGVQSAQLKDIRAADPHGQGRHSFTAQQQTLRRLNSVFAAYLRRARDRKGNVRRVGYPRFKPYQRFDQVLILDAGWSQFTSILVAKAASAGRRVVLVHPAYTSIDCHTCGARCSRPRRDTVVCAAHGALDADLNGARNIATRAGLGSDQAPAA